MRLDLPIYEVIEEFAYSQYGAMYDGETDESWGIWTHHASLTLPGSVE